MEGELRDCVGNSKRAKHYFEITNGGKKNGQFLEDYPNRSNDMVAQLCCGYVPFLQKSGHAFAKEEECIFCEEIVKDCTKMCEHVVFDCVKLDGERLKSFGEDKCLKMGMCRNMGEALMTKEIHKYVESFIRKGKEMKSEEVRSDGEREEEAAMAKAG